MKTRRSAFTLLETLIAGVIAVIVFSAAVSATGLFATSEREAREVTGAVMIAEEALSRFAYSMRWHDQPAVSGSLFRPSLNAGTYVAITSGTSAGVFWCANAGSAECAQAIPASQYVMHQISATATTATTALLEQTSVTSITPPACRSADLRTVYHRTATVAVLESAAPERVRMTVAVQPVCRMGTTDEFYGKRVVRVAEYRRGQW